LSFVIVRVTRQARATKTTLVSLIRWD